MAVADTPLSSVGASLAAALALGCAVAGTLSALYAGWECAFGHLGYLAGQPFSSPEMLGPRIELTLIILIGFTVGAHAYARREIARDIEDLAPLLHRSAQERAALLREARGSVRDARSWLGSLAAVPIALLVVTSRGANVPYLLSDEPWNHDFVWALACNVLLFAVLGRIAVQSVRTNELFAGVEARLGPVDLLRPEALAPFARRGLRTAFLWIGGSSIASVVFVNQGFSLLTGLVLVATLLMGGFAFVHPVRGLHGRIRAAKEAELERVRAALACAREELLKETGSVAEASRMPGLLGYEQRIASVPEWPLEAPQIARFGLIVLIGLGSWLGGAVVEHVLDAFWR